MKHALLKFLFWQIFIGVTLPFKTFYNELKSYYCCVSVTAGATETCHGTCMDSSGDSVGLALPFYLYVIPGNQTQLSELVQQTPLPSRQLTGP